MAKQAGIIKLNGRIGDLSFYDGKNGFAARQAKGFSAERVQNDPKLQRMRENMAEFGRAGKASKLLRTALRSVLLTGADPQVSRRLTQAMMRALSADDVNNRGLRTVVDGDLQLLRGFEFNAKAPITQTFYAPFTPVVNRATGLMSVLIDAFNARNVVAAPKGATHFKLISAAVSANFETNAYAIVSAESANTPVDEGLVAAIAFDHQLEAGTTDPLFLVLGIEFSQVIGNGQSYPLNNGSFNGLSLVAVDVAP